MIVDPIEHQGNYLQAEQHNVEYRIQAENLAVQLLLQLARGGGKNLIF